MSIANINHGNNSIPFAGIGKFDRQLLTVGSGMFFSLALSRSPFSCSDGNYGRFQQFHRMPLQDYPLFVTDAAIFRDGLENFRGPARR